MKKISWHLIFASLIILLVAIGYVSAVSDNDLIFDEDDNSELEGNDGLELDDEDEDDGDDEDDWDDDEDDEDDFELDDEDEDDEDDWGDDGDDEDDWDDEEEDDDWDDERFGEFDGEFSALAAGMDFAGAKGNINDAQNIDSSLQTGNPLFVLLLSLLFLIVIPLRNR